MSSATNRGGQRIDQDQYFTPHPFTYAIAPLLFGPGCQYGFILDPAAGRGDLLLPLRRAGIPAGRMVAIELDGVRVQQMRSNPELADVYAMQADGIAALQQVRSTVTIIMNPPYSHAFQFVRAAVQAAERCGGQAAAFLRLGFLASDKRRRFLEQYPPLVRIASRRPCFVKVVTHLPDGKTRTSTTDASEYAWICWRFGKNWPAVRELGWLNDDPAEIAEGLRAAGFVVPGPLALEGPEAPTFDVYPDP